MVQKKHKKTKKAKSWSKSEHIFTLNISGLNISLKRQKLSKDFYKIRTEVYAT